MCSTMCRACRGRVGLLRVDTLRGHPTLLEQYEKLTNKKLIAAATMCFTCVAHLQRSRRLSAAAHSSHKIRQETSATIEETHSHTALCLGMTHHSTSTVIAVPHVTLTDNWLNIESTILTVKQEQVVVKEKITDEEDSTDVERNNKDVELNDKTWTGNHTGQKPYFCNVCKKSFIIGGNFKRHMRSHTAEKPYVCNECYKSFMDECNLQKHMRLHTGEKPSICNVCNESFIDGNKLKQHMRLHTGEKPYVCNETHSHTAALSLGMTHHLTVIAVPHVTLTDNWLNNESTILTVKQEQVVVKEETTDKRDSTVVARNYEDVELNDITYNKKQCLNEERNETIKVKHPYAPYVTNIIIVCDKKQKVCPTCHRAFKTSSALTSHIRSHTGEKPYVCKACKKSFINGSILKQHIRSHTGEKPYVCKECDKTFSQTGNLRVHMRTHSGEKPYVCNECNKRFIDGANLNKHMRRHTGEKPYGCNECDKIFSQLGNLKKHMRIHTGEKPYVCNVCNKPFIQAEVLKRHMLIHSRKRAKGHKGPVPL